MPQESRASLYFLDKDLVQFFAPDFTKTFTVKGISNETKIDFVRCLSLLSQYNKDGVANYLARSYKQQMETYYDDYIYSVVADLDSKYGKFSTMFPDRKYDDRFSNLQQTLNSLEIPNQYPSIIDMDLYFFGLIYTVVFESKTIDIAKKGDLKKEIEDKIIAFKLDTSHTKAPSNFGHLRSRISSSIEIYQRYVS